MCRVRRAQMSAREKAKLWTRRKRGESPTDIGCALARDRSVPSAMWRPRRAAVNKIGAELFTVVHSPEGDEALTH